MLELLESRNLFSNGFRVVGYLPDYEYVSAFTHLNWAAITQINYFSVVPSATGTLPSASNSSFNTSSGGYALSQISSVVDAAHLHGVKADIVLSGTNFPTIAASSSLSSTFVANLGAFCSTYNLDGVDIDWEPNSFTSQQVTDYGNLIAAIHTGDPSLDLSAAVNSYLPNLLDTLAMTDLTTINVMTYDYTYNSNAPLSPTESQMQTFASQLSSAGLPSTKLNFGLPFYGRAGTSWANSTAETYNDIVNGYIQQTGQAPSSANDVLNVSFANAFGGATTAWSFNGPTTIGSKTQFALANDGGVMIWNLGQDHFNAQGQYDQYSLLPVINSIVNPPATQLAFVQQPANSVVGSAINPAVKVDVETATGSVVSTDASKVTLTVSSGPTGASLGSGITVAAVNGVATFSNLLPNLPGIYVLSASDGSLSNATSQSFQVLSTLPAWLSSNSVAAYNYSSHVLVVTGAASIIGDPGSDLPLITASGSSAQLTIAPAASEQIHIASLALLDGASATMPAASATPLILLISNSISVDSYSRLDLGNNALDVSLENLTEVNTLVSQGCNGGTWSGTGIASSTAAGDTTHLTALGCMVNNIGTSSPLIPTFDGQQLGAADVLVKYIYLGDSNLSGSVDGTDYSRIDVGFLTHLTGWANGDFNYDGVIDGSDYTLIDNAFNTQRTPLINPAALIAFPKVEEKLETTHTDNLAAAISGDGSFSLNKKTARAKPITSLIAAVMAAMRA